MRILIQTYNASVRLSGLEMIANFIRESAKIDVRTVQIPLLAILAYRMLN